VRISPSPSIVLTSLEKEGNGGANFLFGEPSDDGGPEEIDGESEETSLEKTALDAFLTVLGVIFQVVVAIAELFL
jgi:hypothetical protein